MHKLFYIVLILFVAGCVQEYIPPVKPSGSSWLVVEGSLNSGPGEATLVLSRTTNLDTSAQQFEVGAEIAVQADDSSSFALTETNPGSYSAYDLNLNSSKKYRLKIKTANGETYASDFVPVIPNPPIDSISYQQTGEGLPIFIHTHNPQNNTRYYKWKFNETWEFHSAYLSKLKYVITQTPNGDVYSLKPAVVAYYPPDPYDSTIFICWQSDSSTEILLGSTAALSEDRVNLPLTTIPAGSQKLTVLYSIDIVQYGWSEAGYQFLQAMKKNTETTGSVFNPLPSQLIGNIHCLSDPSKMVVGYFNVSPEQERRFFISAADVPGWNSSMKCPLFEISNDADAIAKLGTDLHPIVAAKTKHIPFSLALAIVTFTASYPDCVDCTLNGTNIKPPFWP
jgi:hypothetical protein